VLQVGWKTLGAAVAIAAVAFVFRFNTHVEGSLGGFSNDHFAHLMRADMLLRGEQPLRNFADAELRGAWPALSYAVPAWAQRIGGRTLLPEAYLTLGAIAIGHAIVFLVALDLSKRWSVALLATLLAIATMPRAYSYPKVVMFALGAWVLRSSMANPSFVRLAIAAFVTAVATLFRHDLGVYVAAGLIAGLIAREGSNWKAGVKSAGAYSGLTMLWLLPSAIWVQVYQGIPSYIRANLFTAAQEAERTKLESASLTVAGLWTSDGLILLTYYALWSVLVVAALVVVLRVVRGSLTPSDRGTVGGLAVVVVLALHFLVRGSLSQRFGDAIVPVVLLGAWSAGAADAIATPLGRASALLLPVALLGAMLVAMWIFGGLAGQLETSRMTKSWSGTWHQFATVRDNLRRLPPVTWNDDLRAQMPAAAYVAECTAPDDHLLVAAEAPEIYVFARRPFAAGQGTFGLGLYTSDADQIRAIGRLKHQSVPIILADASRFKTEFVFIYKRVADYMASRYRQAGTIDEGRFLVFVDASLQPRRLHPRFGLPCFQ
jgi:hypothetical protein